MPAQIYNQLLRAESKGRYFNSYIRNRFKPYKVSGKAPVQITSSLHPPLMADQNPTTPFQKPCGIRLKPATTCLTTPVRKSCVA